ncbi:hypothetical protein GCM10020295_36750 [Streptomyces cinereospinus]
MAGGDFGDDTKVGMGGRRRCGIRGARNALLIYRAVIGWGAGGAEGAWGDWYGAGLSAVAGREMAECAGETVVAA